IIGLLLGIFSCKKEAGEGGRATIKGKIWAQDWNAGFTVKNGEYAATDEDVYIIYGNNVSYGDKVKTNYNGEFEFKYLRTGKYTIYVYSKDNTLKSQSGDTVFVKEVNITSKKQTVTLDQITIYK
ncbi:MAG: hypothetical protein IT236_07115, partial [Bacteroidia bacterium]|nr:hypothetical protein [Bacteroidia bacterium]